jgi:hypothetical protein
VHALLRECTEQAVHPRLGISLEAQRQLEDMLAQCQRVVESDIWTVLTKSMAQVVLCTQRALEPPQGHTANYARLLARAVQRWHPTSTLQLPQRERATDSTPLQLVDIGSPGVMAVCLHQLDSWNMLNAAVHILYSDDQENARVLVDRMRQAGAPLPLLHMMRRSSPAVSLLPYTIQMVPHRSGLCSRLAAYASQAFITSHTHELSSVHPPFGP